MLAVPPEHRERFTALAAAVVDVTLPDADRTAANAALEQHVAHLLDRRVAQPSHDLLSRLAAHVRDGRLTRAHAVRNVRLIIAAGNETTGNMIALGTLSLLKHPEARAAMSTPTGTARVVEELLRLWSIVQAGPRRTARGGLTLAGRWVPAGTGLIASLPAANRDPSVFRCRSVGLDALDTEADSRGHVAFGAGTHQCLGQRLARAELRAALSVLVTRLPGLRLAAAPDRLRFLTDHAILGLRELPVTW